MIGTDEHGRVIRDLIWFVEYSVLYIKEAHPTRYVHLHRPEKKNRVEVACMILRDLSIDPNEVCVVAVPRSDRVSVTRHVINEVKMNIIN